MNKKIYLTEKGLKKVKKELKDLVESERIKVAKRIKKAKDFGDLSENVEYDEAKNEQMKVEKRISKLRKMIKRAELPPETEEGVVGIGSKVTLKFKEKDNNVAYQLVGDYESEPAKGKISYLSPVGKSLMGREVDENVEIETPAGKNQAEIIEVERG